MAYLFDSNVFIFQLNGVLGDTGQTLLRTAFGGGKTHTMLAVYHLAKGEVPVSDMPGLSAIFDGSGITELPRARVAVLDGIKFESSAGFDDGLQRVVKENCNVLKIQGEFEEGDW